MQFNSFWNLFFGVFFLWLVWNGVLCICLGPWLFKLHFKKTLLLWPILRIYRLRLLTPGVKTSTRDASNSGHQKIGSIFSRIPIETFMSLHFQ